TTASGCEPARTSPFRRSGRRSPGAPAPAAPGRPRGPSRRWREPGSNAAPGPGQAPSIRAAPARARSSPSSPQAPRRRRPRQPARVVRSFAGPVGDDVVDPPAARADSGEGLAGEHLLDSLRQGRRILALGARLFGEGLVARLVLVLLVPDRGAAPGAELRSVARRHRVEPTAAQQILGRGSPASMSTTRGPPKGLWRGPSPGGSGVPSAPTAASEPIGCERSASRASSSASGETTATSLPSLAT